MHGRVRGGRVQERWPMFLAEASKADIRAVFAFRVRIAAIALGAIDLYQTSPGRCAGEISPTP